jgi:hypothetical protein
MRSGRLGVGMGHIGLREVRGIGAPEDFRPDFTGVTVPPASPYFSGGKGVELDASGRGE